MQAVASIYLMPHLDIFQELAGLTSDDISGL